MGKGFQDLLERAKRLRLEGASAETSRTRLLEDGWDLNTIDRALWQLGLRDRANVYFVRRFKKFALVFGAVFGLALIVVGSLYVDGRKQSDMAAQSDAAVAGAQEEAVELSGDPIRSEEAGISFDFPQLWELRAVPFDEPGVYVWQLEPVGNKPIKQQLEQEYGIGSGEGDASIATLALLSDPRVGQLVTINIVVNTAPEQPVESSLDEWKANVDQRTEQFGTSVSEFVRVQQDGVDGYSYRSAIELAQISVLTQEYVFVTDSTRVEVSVFPADAKRPREVQSIIGSLTFDQ